jgi:hypothetical protein
MEAAHPDGPGRRRPAARTGGHAVKLPFRVFVLTGGGTSRVVIDVAHKWRA